MKFKQFYQQTHDLIQLLKVQFPHINVQMITLAFCRSTPNFILLFGYSRILDLLLTSQFQDAIQVVTIMLVSAYLLSFIGNWIDSYLQGYEFITDEVITSQVNYMSFTMRYDIFEDNESMAKVRAVGNHINASGGTGSFLRNIILLYTNLFSVLYALCFVGYLFYQAMQYSLYLVLLLLLAVGCICLGIIILKRTSAYHEDLNAKNIHNNSVSSYLITTMVNVEYKKQIMINQMSHLFGKYFKNIIKTFHVYLDFSKRKGRYEAVYNFALSIFGACTYIYIAYLSLHGYLSIGSVLLYAGAMQQLIQYISGWIISYSDAVFQLDYLNHFTDFLHDESIRTIGSLPIEKRNDNAYEFCFENVSFHYPNSKQLVLYNVNLTFKIGEKLALVGQNGAGKTTIIKLLCRLYQPTEGRILLNGIDIQKFDFNDYTKIFSPVFQDFSMFNISAKENLECGHHNEEKDINAVIADVGLEKRFSSSQNGMDCVLEDLNSEGVKLSGGEAQKLAIARALYKDAPFVILDEPTAALDPFSEAEIYENFDELVGGKTAIYISHRMSSCKFCDRIVVFKGGKLVEDGNHDSLMHQQGEYYTLYQAQAEYYQQ